MKCDVCGKSEPEVRFEYSRLTVCEGCAGEAWRATDEDELTSEEADEWPYDVIPIYGEVSPDACADYPTHPAQVAADEAGDDGERLAERLRFDAYQEFEAVAGAPEWQPSAEARALVKELNG